VAQGESFSLVLLGLLDQAQHYLWTSRPTLTLHGPNLFYL